VDVVTLIHALPEHLELPEHGLIGDVPPLSLLHHGIDLEQHAVQPPELVLCLFCLGPSVPLDRLGQRSFVIAETMSSIAIATMI
jgi:hypothetical protein